MAYRYKLTPLAIADIDDALDYISGKLLNPGAADNLYQRI
jgi:plasmid stabilization system protein ParE